MKFNPLTELLRQTGRQKDQSAVTVYMEINPIQAHTQAHTHARAHTHTHIRTYKHTCTQTYTESSAAVGDAVKGITVWLPMPYPYELNDFQ